jgi:hypothetical protein
MSNRLIDIFPPDDKLALFVLAMCAASNDVDASDQEARAANDPPGTNDPDHTHRTRFTYHVRRSLGHLFEAIAALKAWRRDEVEVRQLLASLSPRGKARLKLVCGVEQRVGPAVLRSTRNGSFHYPRPGTDYVPDPVGELADAIRVNPDMEAGYDLLLPAEGAPGEERPRPRRRYRVADQMMISIAFGGYDHDATKAREQMDLVHQAAEEFCELVDELVDLYCKRRDLRLGEDSD